MRMDVADNHSLVEAMKSKDTEAATALLQNYQTQSHRSGPDEDIVQPKSRSWRSTAIVYGFECLESTGFNGVLVNLAVYFSTVLKESNSATVAKVSTWNGTSYLMPLVGAFMADAYLGNYRTILISGLLYIPGMVMVTISARPVSEVDKVVFFCGLYLVAIGSGGVKAALIPHAMEQFDCDDESLTESQTKAEFFNWFYVCLAFGSLASGTIIVWIQVNVGWGLGFGLSTICVALALSLFIAGTPAYRIGKPTGSPLKGLLQVMVASMKKFNVELPADDGLLHEVRNEEVLPGKHRLAHTKEFKFLDKAATKMNSDSAGKHAHNPWNLCTVTQVEELKILLRLVPIWTTGIVFNAGYSQLFSTFIEQGRAMKTRVFSFTVLPASLASLEVIFVMVWALVFHHFKNCVRISQLQRIGVGRLLMILTMASAAMVESERLQRRKMGEEISILWQIPYYFVLGGAEMFCNVGQLEFFYEQAPESMKSLCVAFALLCVSLGSYLNSMLVTAVEFLTAGGGRKGWLPDDLDDGHLDYYFWGLTVLSCFNFVFYVVLAHKYSLKKVLG